MNDFAARLRTVRQSKGVTRYRLAQLTGMSKQGILNLERPGADPKLSTVVKLAKALGVGLWHLMPGGPEGSLASVHQEDQGMVEQPNRSSG